MARLVLADGTEVSALGQGSWPMGERGADRGAEAAALGLGRDLGMTLIDTAEMYAEGGAEAVCLLSKVLPPNAGGARLVGALERSLRRLRTDRLDLYLLHWPGSLPLADTVAALERMQAAGKIRRWGVAQCDVADPQEFGPALPGCASNQALQDLQQRGIAFDLPPFRRGRCCACRRRWRLPGPCAAAR